MPGPDTIEPARIETAGALALQALVWTLQSQSRAERLLALTGLSVEELRGGAGEPGVLAAILSFLEGHEADLIECADSLGVRPEALVAARRTLEAA
ncbi:hypothetical protein QE385_002287 [Sphingomonas sp. SORGH_AS 950]|uniref:DUF3572 family protein n=1 Tax=unclassified Sphingomonas TaxID=196159 RepID=UPI00277DF942|nr:MULTISPECIES: DUF3572 family protein [unclassified Sphingomonas]MDQ1157960.1 hypothetical protein [Sphingomonas sp. SORGH_AS_0950]MDR6114138.1 hypothetical protein [Sphingomonas sp. SORGH_AS_0789]MDR6144688.1 hypothetical protein [Sphingomonas sp. SORGH_AS_0870]MDR6148501.1 hypothetical protein [Sphingomonas sp. SORGH_AS_0742]